MTPKLPPHVTYAVLQTSLDSMPFLSRRGAYDTLPDALAKKRELVATTGDSHVVVREEYAGTGAYRGYISSRIVA